MIRNDSKPRSQESIQLSLTQILGTLSFALDLTTGQPMGHAQRTCAIGMKIADVLNLGAEQRQSLYPALLLKDAGCSTNSARMYEVFGGNELDAKRMSKIVDWTNLLEAIKYATAVTLPKGSILARARKLIETAKEPSPGQQFIKARCTRGADIALQVGLTPEAAECIRALDEHWDGKGNPYHLKGEQIPFLARIACLSQTLEVFVKTFGRETAYEVIQKRAGRWFDPEMVRAAFAFERDDQFWAMVYTDPSSILRKIEMESVVQMATDLRIDSVCSAFAQIVDAKSPFTAEHSTRVSEYTVRIAQTLGISGERLVLLRRASLLHDIGKLAVPNTILDHPGKPSDDDWAVIRKHPFYTQQILEQIPGFERISEVASAHHERLDGKGYHRGFGAEQLDLDMRIIAVADVFDALSAKRPYRDALPFEEVMKIMERDSGHALDSDCLDAVRSFGRGGSSALQSLTSSRADLPKAA